MESIEDGSIDLCMADPPYNLNIGSMGLRKTMRKNAGSVCSKEVYYDDSMTKKEYVAFTKRWTAEVFRVCKRTIVTPGEKNLMTWYKRVGEPVGFLYHYKSNSCSPGYVSWKMCIETILLYGNWHKKQCFAHDVFNIPLNTQNDDDLSSSLIHPCPKCYELWSAILKGYLVKYGKPNVVLDPFIGSGTTAEACCESGVDFLGFEKETGYRVDIEERVRMGKRRNHINSFKLKKVI